MILCTLGLAADGGRSLPDTRLSYGFCSWQPPCIYTENKPLANIVTSTKP